MRTADIIKCINAGLTVIRPVDLPKIGFEVFKDHDWVVFDTHSGPLTKEERDRILNEELLQKSNIILD